MKQLWNKFIRKWKPDFDSESRVLIKNSSWVFAANTTGAVYAFLKSVIIARGLGAEILGIYTVAVAFVLTIQEIFKLNVAMGVIRYGAIFRNENRPDKIIALIKGSVLASLSSAFLSVVVIWLIISLAYSDFIDTPGLQNFIIIYAAVNGLAFLDNIGKGVLKLYFKFKVNSIVQMIMDTVEFILVSLCVLLYPGNLEYFFSTVIIARLLNTIICNFAVIAELRKELGNYISTSVKTISTQFREISNFILGNSFSNTLRILMNQGDVLLLGWLTGPSVVGMYAVAKKLAYSVLTITDPLVTSIFPQLSVLISAKQFTEVRTMIRKITGIILPPVLLCLVVAFFLREYIITTVYGKEFSGAANPFFIHLLGAVQGAVFFWCLPLIQSLGLTMLRVRVYLAAIIAGGITAFTLGFSYKASGVAAGLLIANIFITICFVWFAHKKMHEQAIESESKNLVL